MNIDFCQQEFSGTEIVTWKYHIDEYDKGRYDMIMGRYLLTALVPDIYISEHVIIGGDRPFKGCSSPMVGVRKYDLTYLTDKLFKPE